MFKKPIMNKFSNNPRVLVRGGRVCLKDSSLYNASVSEQGVSDMDIMKVFESVWCNDVIDKHDDKDD